MKMSRILPAMKLQARYVEKPWGKCELPAIFSAPAGQRIGEIWFAGTPSASVFAKYLFTNESLSIQVHPNDEQAQQCGASCGKTECWYVVDAVPGAMIGLGLREALSLADLRRAAEDGSIVDAIGWRPVRSGDFLYVPAGTIHAVGGGITLIEFQRSSDLTYRLYDYDRQREIHLEQALAVAQRSQFPAEYHQHPDANRGTVLLDSAEFAVALSAGDAFTDRRRWVLPLKGRVRCGNEEVGAGECLVAEPGASLEVENAELLIGAPR